MAHPRSRELWAITSYFNPVGYRQRLENYRLFRQCLQTPLVTVELTFNGTFQLQREDADILVQIHGADVMWQKERLLNLALAALPTTCDRIAWIDCDVIFQDEDWPQRACRALDQYPLVHLFHERHDPPRDVSLDQLRCWDAPATAYSTVYIIAVGQAPTADFFMSGTLGKRGRATGLAWASRRAVLENHGLYDACIIGSGDSAILYAALGEFDCLRKQLRMNAQREAHYRAWAQPFFEAVCGRVGYIEGRLFHLWHGDMEARRYAERHRCFETFDFDPYTDIALDANGCWRWNSDKREMHEFIRSYFASRNEDGGGEL
jgi:hypothetical protein